MNNQLGLSMFNFSPIEIMVGVIAIFICLGLFLDYGKRKHWDKPQIDKQNKI